MWKLIRIWFFSVIPVPNLHAQCYWKFLLALILWILHGRYAHWVKASPWLFGANPRDLIMPVDGDDGFYPTGNELVLFCIVYLLNLALMYWLVYPLQGKTFVYRNLKLLVPVASIGPMSWSVLHPTQHLMRLCYVFLTQVKVSLLSNPMQMLCCMLP